MPTSLSPARIFLGFATAIAVSAIVVLSVMLLSHSRQARLSQSAKLGQAVQGVAGVVTVKELAEPWSSKTFIFHSSNARENTSSIVIRLPEGTSDQPGSYWALSL